jgi:hypothetical protein
MVYNMLVVFVFKLSISVLWFIGAKIRKKVNCMLQIVNGK